MSTIRGSWSLIQLGKAMTLLLGVYSTDLVRYVRYDHSRYNGNVCHALLRMQKCAADKTRSHSAEIRSMLQCTPSLSSSVPRVSSPPPRWLFLADPPPIRRAPAG